MPHISSLQLTDFRNIQQANLRLSPQFNLFFGDNGSGKTSLLEAIYYLGLRKSFRSKHHERIITKGADNFSIFCNATERHNTFPLGLSRNSLGERQIKLDNSLNPSSGEVVKRFPLLFINTDSYRFFHDGPKIRRQFLDWAAFHVKQQFHPAWLSYQRAIKQRNAVLKARGNPVHAHSWNIELDQTANIIDQCRRETVELLKPIVISQIKTFLPQYELSLHYYRGWNEKTNLETALLNGQNKDYALGYTYCGPHRADLELYVDQLPAQDVLSQGQQKLASYILLLSKGILFKEHHPDQINPIYLIDDLPSELDEKTQHYIKDILIELKAQTFITGIEQRPLQVFKDSGESNLMFHVNHGTFNSVYA